LNTESIEIQNKSKALRESHGLEWLAFNLSKEQPDIEQRLSHLDNDPEIDIIEALVDSGYEPILEPFPGSGKMKDCYFVYQDKNKKHKRVAVIDKPLKDLSEKSRKNKQKGNDVENEGNILRNISDRKEHYIIDYYHKIKLSDGRYMHIIEYFPGEPLFDYVKKNGPFSAKGFEQVADKLLVAISHVYNDGYLHRDTHTGNILVREDKDGFDARLIDFGNASDKESLEQRLCNSTAMSSIIAMPIVDPFTISGLTSEPIKYSVASELYALGTGLYYALTGKDIFYFNKQTGEARVRKTDKNLLDENGLLDIELYEQELANALDDLPKEVRKYSEILYKLLSLESRMENPEENAFYKSVDKNKESINPFETLIQEYNEIKDYDPDKLQQVLGSAIDNTHKLQDLLDQRKQIINKGKEKKSFFSRILGNKYALAAGAIGLIGLLVFGKDYLKKDSLVFDHPPIAEASQTITEPATEQENRPIIEEKQPAQEQEESTLEQTLNDHYGLQAMKQNIKKHAYVNTGKGDWKYVDVHNGLDRYQDTRNGTIVLLSKFGIVDDFFFPTAVNEIITDAYMHLDDHSWRHVGNIHFEEHGNLNRYQHKKTGNVVCINKLGIIREYFIPTAVDEIEYDAYIDTSKSSHWRYVDKIYFEEHGNLDRYQDKDNGSVICINKLDIVKEYFIPTGFNDIKYDAYMCLDSNDWKNLGKIQSEKHGTLNRYQNKETGTIVCINRLSILKDFFIPTSVN